MDLLILSSSCYYPSDKWDNSVNCEEDKELADIDNDNDIITSLLSRLKMGWEEQQPRGRSSQTTAVSRLKNLISQCECLRVEKFDFTLWGCNKPEWPFTFKGDLQL